MPWENKKLMAVLVGLLLLTFWAGIRYAKLGAASQNRVPGLEGIGSGPRSEAFGEEHAAPEWQVYVAGAVDKPGVYRLPQGARVYEALAMAGANAQADLRDLGMARELVDGETIVVPLQGETQTGGVLSTAGSGSSPGGKININRATVQELDAGLEGIGTGLAQRIVDYRTANGPFRKVEDIRKVGGIGDKRFEAIKNVITVN